MQIETVRKAVNQILANEEAFAVEQREIRGVSYTTFKNAPDSVRELLGFCLQHGDIDFLVYEDERCSFLEFHRNTVRLAHLLVDDYDVKPGDHVALSMRNVPEYPMLFMAIASIGAVPVFLNSWWTTQELEYGFDDCGARLAFVDQPRADNMQPFAKRCGIETVVVRTGAAEKVPEFWSLFDSHASDTLPDVTIHPDDDFAVLYTSGTSGQPKGVVLTHRSAVNAVMSWLFGVRLAELTGTSPPPTIDADGNPYRPCSMITTPFFHISATHPGFLLSLWMGLKAVTMYKWDPVRAVELIEREKVSRFSCVPTMSAELITTAKAMGKKLESLRTVDSGGAKRPAAQVAQIAENLPHVAPGNGFGMTETGGPGIGIRAQFYIDNPDASGRVQQPLMEMRIVDENDNDVAVGEVGELLLKSVCNMRCYLNKEEATAEALRDGWLYTGDLAKVDESELVTIVDRKKDIIIRGGENIACTEVQAVIHDHPDVAEAAVFPIPDERLGEDVGSCVYLRPGARVSEDELKAFLRSHMSSFKVPKKIWFRETPLPRGATEKIDRLALKAEYVR